MSWNYRNRYPECLEQTWSKEPEHLQDVVIQLGAKELSDNIRWDANDKKFVKKNGCEIHNIIAWKNIEN